MRSGVSGGDEPGLKVQGRRQPIDLRSAERLSAVEACFRLREIFQPAVELDRQVDRDLLIILRSPRKRDFGGRAVEPSDRSFRGFGISALVCAFDLPCGLVEGPADVEGARLLAFEHDAIDEVGGAALGFLAKIIRGHDLAQRGLFRVGESILVERQAALRTKRQLPRLGAGAGFLEVQTRAGVGAGVVSKDFQFRAVHGAGHFDFAHFGRRRARDRETGEQAKEETEDFHGRGGEWARLH
jgi:hypothetical protein